ncbi:LysR family nitrogen assimilation transcriptional regulator [Variovorax boronicumulans]|uniref:LysR substrate-binding domain-containing protein n=1 Tax=Variovorax boronicumulans TaxID=436515 RepID=UPI0027804806|nr:LysR substrate-binding domain-containing protein [Variovorax boronicumulans]MDQ0073417.1 LysR family nitrogen assimilation transcriptional regulator [Variovorax boronicumulans]
MDLKQLEYFVHVAEMSSFTKASNFLSVAQPALSRQIRSLEVELRQTLLERNGRGVTLTPAGQRLLEHSRGILAQVSRAKLELEDDRHAVTGRIVIAMPPSVSRTLTGPLVRAFRERYPKAVMSMVEGLSTYALEWLSVGRVDCAVVYNVAPSGNIDLLPVLDEQLYLVSGRARTKARTLEGPTITLSDVAQHELVIPSRPHSLRMLLETAMAQQGLKPKVALEIESIPAILDLVRDEDFSAVLALNAIRSTGNTDGFHVRPIGNPKLITTLWIATSAQRPRGPLIEQSTALLKELLLSRWA